MDFKRLSEVDMGTADDSTNVIAEVGGEIKRVPKSEVGGAGGYVMTLTADNYNSGSGVCTENYDEMYDVLMDGGSVWIDASYSFPSDTPARFMCLGWTIIDEGLKIRSGTNGSMEIIFPNGSHNPGTPSGGGGGK